MENGLTDENLIIFICPLNKWSNPFSLCSERLFYCQDCNISPALSKLKTTPLVDFSSIPVLSSLNQDLSHMTLYFLSLDFRFSHVTCFGQWSSQERPPNSQSTYIPMSLKINDYGCMPPNWLFSIIVALDNWYNS